MTKTGRPKTTQAQRRHLVEEALRTRGWSYTVAHDLVARTGWSLSTIYRDRDAVLDELAEEESERLPRKRAQFLVDLRRLRAKAEEADRFGDAARLIDLEGKVLGVDRIPLPDVDPDEVVDTSLEYLLGEVRQMRRQARAADSHVAAAKLLDREVELAKAIQERDDRARAERLEHLSEEEVAQELIEALRSLPEPLRAVVLESVGEE